MLATVQLAGLVVLARAHALTGLSRLQPLHGTAHGGDEKIEVVAVQVPEGHRVHVASGGLSRAAQFADLLSKMNGLGSCIRCMCPALDQPVPLHPGEGVGHGRLFDIETLEQVALCQSVLLPQRQQRHELRRREAKRSDALMQALREEPRHVVGEVARRTGAIESVGAHGRRIVLA